MIPSSRITLTKPKIRSTQHKKYATFQKNSSNGANANVSRSRLCACVLCMSLCTYIGFDFEWRVRFVVLFIHSSRHVREQNSNLLNSPV